MSHFSVLVIGDDIDSRLQPFHKFECTGIDDQYVQNIDRLQAAKDEYATKEREETLAQFIERRYRTPIVDIGEPITNDKYKYRWCRVDSLGVSEFVIRTNPNAKWDWWSVGGGWQGFLILKTGEPSESARKGDIDFEAIRSKRVAEATAEFDLFESVTVNCPSHTSWEEVRTAFEDDIETARNTYQAQPAIAAMQSSGDISWLEADKFLVDRDTYIEMARRNAVVPFAILYNGEWHQKGRMDRFGGVLDEMAVLEWLKVANGIIDSLPDDTLLTIVDCHI